MRLSVNVIAGSPSRYYRAGEEIDDSQVPETLRKFELRDDDEGDTRKPPKMHAEKLSKRSSR